MKHETKQVEDTLESLERNAAVNIKEATKIGRGWSLIEDIVTSDTVKLNCYGGTFWLEVFNREDLQALMTIAPQWSKETNGDVISYSAEVKGVWFRINAHEAALPDTCKLVEEIVEVPAQPARTEKRMVVKCKPRNDEAQEAQDEQERLNEENVEITNNEATQE